MVEILKIETFSGQLRENNFDGIEEKILEDEDVLMGLMGLMGKWTD